MAVNQNAIPTNSSLGLPGPTSTPLRNGCQDRPDTRRGRMQGQAVESSWRCQHCNAEVAPFEFELWGVVRYVRRRWCGCADAQKERLLEQMDERERQAGALVINAGLQMGKLMRFTFETWDQNRTPMAAKALEIVQGYVDNVAEGGKNWLLLHGPYGVGKTHLAVAALRKIAFERFWAPVLAVWPAQCSAVQQSWDNNGGGGAGLSEGQLWGQMQAAGILLIDDIDKREPTPWAIGKLYEVISHRHLREKPTIFTANHSLKDLATSWCRSRSTDVKDAGAAILSRIAEQLYAVAEMDGKDQRWG